MTTKSELLKVVRTKCLECSVHQPSEVRNCHLQDCSLWRFRFGKDPNPAKRGFAENPAASRSVSAANCSWSLTVAQKKRTHRKLELPTGQ